MMQNELIPEPRPVRKPRPARWIESLSDGLWHWVPAEKIVSLCGRWAPMGKIGDPVELCTVCSDLRAAE